MNSVLHKLNKFYDNKIVGEDETLQSTLHNNQILLMHI